MLLATVSFAQAYTVNFDWQGTGESSNLNTYDAFQLLSNETFNTDYGDWGDIFTYQNPTTGDFIESFSVEVSKGYKTGPDVEFSNIFLTVSLMGNFNFLNNTVTFEGGSASMDQGSNNIATFLFNSAIAHDLTGSLTGTEDLGMEIDFEFAFDTVNSNYWGVDELSLVDKKWLLSVVGGSIDQDGIRPFGDELIVKWQFPGAQMEFNAVPEPSTILLLGSGLLGVAFFGRRKLAKKS